jgi:hypothetical protein
VPRKLARRSPAETRLDLPPQPQSSLLLAEPEFPSPFAKPKRKLGRRFKPRATTDQDIRDAFKLGEDVAVPQIFRDFTSVSRGVMKDAVKQFGEDVDSVDTDELVREVVARIGESGADVQETDFDDIKRALGAAFRLEVSPEAQDRSLLESDELRKFLERGRQEPIKVRIGRRRGRVEEGTPPPFRSKEAAIRAEADFEREENEALLQEFEELTAGQEDVDLEQTLDVDQELRGKLEAAQAER